MEFKVGDKVVMNRESKYFKSADNNISLAWWYVLEQNTPITLVDVEKDENGINIFTTDCNNLRVTDLWVLPYKGDG